MYEIQIFDFRSVSITFVLRDLYLVIFHLGPSFYFMTKNFLFYDKNYLVVLKMSMFMDIMFLFK